MPGRKRSGTLKFKGGTWKARVTEAGERPWYDLETTDRATAERKLDALLARIEADERRARGELERSPMPKFKTAALEWLDRREGQGIASVKSDRPLLELHAFPELGERLVGDIKPGHVRDALERAKRAGRKRGTLKHLYGAISAVLHRAWQDGHAVENVALKVELPETREISKTRIVLTDEEIAAFWASAKVDIEIKLLGVVARVEGGMRTIDLIAWDYEHLDLVAFAFCIVPRTKTGEPQRLEVPVILRAPIAAWWEQHGRLTSGPVFPVTKGERKGERRQARGVSFAKRLRRNLFAAGITRLPPVEGKPNPRDPLYHETPTTRPVDFHSFRRAFAQSLDRAEGVTRKQAMLLTGHGTEEAHVLYLKRAAKGDEVLPLPAAVLPALAPVQTRGEGDPEGAARVMEIGVAVGEMARGWNEMERALGAEER